ncbi:MAG: phosphatase PAP2 family protein [Pseudonocardia sp.]|uniref:phosphatase PAP2 family protein n=1 Tax=unclassified Pseudonocardia TaxID=2619320 RepID=UPI00086DD9DA|nr:MULTISPECIES: phosphatase PAP2 family protein [unclassified Pseudonocardia]MBN9112227.1 phosphatase PAP2 family protein [Pseudonocardia sp.]ODU30164.1 MAG: hypothetical protein ABS80_00740 [Pseudonocardia sp. SCN 72-51]ODV03089.1 MAG: hypothetical protein ABT15_23970 [Pseudonocardia sp. SCN 73-27]
MSQVPVGVFGLPGPINIDWFEQINRWATHTGWPAPVISGFASYGIAVFAALLLTNLWLARRSARLDGLAAALWAPLGVLLAVGVNQLLVAVAHEPRPYTVLPQLTVLAAHSTDYSFPSDHAVMAGATAAGIWLRGDHTVGARRLRRLSVLAALAMAFARVFIGAHWPGDVAAGLVVGAAVSVLGYLCLRRFLVAAVSLAARTPPERLLGVAAPEASRFPVSGSGSTPDRAPSPGPNPHVPPSEHDARRGGVDASPRARRRPGP